MAVSNSAHKLLCSYHIFQRKSVLFSIIINNNINQYQDALCFLFFVVESCRIPELIFWHIPSTAYVKVAPKAKSEIRKPCVGSINKEEVAPQAAEWGMMDALAKRPSVKVRQSVAHSDNQLNPTLFRCLDQNICIRLD